MAPGCTPCRSVAAARHGDCFIFQLCIMLMQSLLDPIRLTGRHLQPASTQLGLKVSKTSNFTHRFRPTLQLVVLSGNTEHLSLVSEPWLELVPLNSFMLEFYWFFFVPI